MVRLVYVILISLPFVLFYLWKSHYVMRHMEAFSESYRYSMVQHMIAIMKHNGRIRTAVYGVENLPSDGGYVMYSNHQGKYDVLGIIAAHKKPCTFLIDEKRSRLPIANEVTTLLEASRLDKTNARKQVSTILDVGQQVASGKKFIIFPEGGYDKNGNELQEFLPGAMKASMRSHAPIVPVALKDSYKVFGVNSLRKVKTEVHFLEPLYYEEYEKMNSREIAQIVKERIQEAISAA